MLTVGTNILSRETMPGSIINETQEERNETPEELEPISSGSSLPLRTDSFPLNKYIYYRKQVEQYKQQQIIIDSGYLGWRTNVDSIFSFEGCMEEIENMYGPVNRTHPTILRCANEFVRNRLEILRATCYDFHEVDKCNGEALGKLLESLEQESEVLIEDLKATVSLEVADSFNLNPFTNYKSVEYVMIPRPRLTYKNVVYHEDASHAENLADSMAACEITTQAVIPRPLPILARPFDGLGCYDPKFSAPLNETIDRGVGRWFALRITEMMNKYPFGISTEVFKSVMDYELDFVVDMGYFGCKTLMELINKLEDICWVRISSHLASPLKVLIFPAGIQGLVCSVDMILKRIWHNYICMLSIIAAPVELEESWTMLEKFMGLKEEEFSIDVWGFDSIEHLIKYCLNLFPYSHLQFLVPVVTDIPESPFLKVSESERAFCPTTQPRKLYVIVGSLAPFEATFTTVEYFLAQAEATKVPPIDNPKRGRFLDQDIEIRWVTDGIQPGSILHCRYCVQVRPNIFGLILQEHTGKCVHLRRRMTKFYMKMIGTRTRVNKTTPATLVGKLDPGIYVATYFQSEWRRAVVVSLLNSKKLVYKLYLLEGACFISRRFYRIARLFSEFKQCPALGIPCTLDIPDLGILDKRQRGDRMKRLGHLYSYNARKLTVKFINYVDNERLNDHSFWTVEVQEADVSDDQLSTTEVRFLVGMNRSLVSRVPRRYPGSRFRDSFSPDQIKRGNAGRGNILNSSEMTMEQEPSSSTSHQNYPETPGPNSWLPRPPKSFPLILPSHLASSVEEGITTPSQAPDAEN